MLTLGAIGVKVSVKLIHTLYLNVALREQCGQCLGCKDKCRVCRMSRHLIGWFMYSIRSQEINVLWLV